MDILVLNKFSVGSDDRFITAKDKFNVKIEITKIFLKSPNDIK